MALHARRAASHTACLEPLEPRVHLSADFNGDGRDDLVWHNEETGANAVWFMDGAEVIGAAALQSVRDTDWLVAEAGDFNGDGKSDLLWRNRVTGANGIWLMDGTAMDSSAWIPQLPDQAWHVRGVGDLDGDGDADILWHNIVSGAVTCWRMDGTQHAGVWDLPGQTNPAYRAAGVGDADGDGDGDIYWIDAPPNGVVAGIWLMQDGARAALQTWTAPAPRPGHLLPVCVRDFDGDGVGEAVVRHPVAAYLGANWVLRLGPNPPQATLTPTRNIHTGWVARDAAPVRADFDDDGVGDLLWLNHVMNDEEAWSFNISAGEGHRFEMDLINGAAWRVAAVADFNMDGEPDMLVQNMDPYSHSSHTHGIWYMRGANLQTAHYYTRLSPEWIIQGADDYNGDGVIDFLVYNAGTREVAAWVQSRWTRRFSEIPLGQLPAGEFTLLGFTDLDHAGTRDFVWRDDNECDNRTVAWLMDGVERISTAEIASPGAGWILHGVQDFDRDGWQDLLWREYDVGETRLWRMNSTTLVESITLPAFHWANVILGARDLDGDGHAEVVFHNAVSGVVTVWRMRGVTRHSLFEAGVQTPPLWQAFFVR